jgi:hypothetical protein
MNIKDAFHGLNINVPTSYTGKPLKYDEMHVDDFKICKDYQRHISPSAIQKGGKLDLKKLTPIVACKRPDGDFFVVDGQHRTLRVIHSDYNEKVPVVIYEHDEDATIANCMKVEAQLFFELNSLSKKPTKLDEVRSGISMKETKSMRIYDALIALEAKCDNVGYLQDDALEVQVFSHFYICINSDYKDDLATVLSGWKFYKKLFPSETKKYINGYMLRACCLLLEFKSELSNGRLTRFSEYVHNVWSKRTIKSITRGRATVLSPQYILDDLINDYNDLNSSKNYTITDKYRNTIADIADNPRFSTEFKL